MTPARITLPLDKACAMIEQDRHIAANSTAKLLLLRVVGKTSLHRRCHLQFSRAIFLAD